MNPIEQMTREAAAVKGTTPEALADRRSVSSPENGRAGGREAITKKVADAFILSQGDPFPIKKHRGQWFKYCRGVYRPLSIDDLRGLIVCFLRRDFPAHATKTMVQNVMENILDVDVAGVPSLYSMPCWLPGGAPASSWMALANGIANVDALAQRIGGAAVDDFAVSREHTHALFSRFWLDFDYQPGAVCPKWLKFLEEVQPDTRMRDLLQMLCGLALVPDTSYEVFFVLFGPAGCGKSVFLYVLEKLVGSANVCTLPLSKFSEKHSMHLLTEALVNMVGDLPTSDGRTGLHEVEGILKDVASGGLIACEPKGIDPFKAPAVARCIFATNSLPAFADRSNGVWDRLRVIPFEQRFRGTEKQNPNLRREIVEAELPGVFLWAVDGLSRLRKMKEFPRGPRGIEIEGRHRADCDHEAQFLLESYAERKGCFLGAGVLYSAYRSFCETAGYRPKHIANFSADVRRVFPGAVDDRRRIGGEKVRGFLNIGQIIAEEGY